MYVLYETQNPGIIIDYVNPKTPIEVPKNKIEIIIMKSVNIFLICALEGFTFLGNAPMKSL